MNKNKEIEFWYSSKIKGKTVFFSIVNWNKELNNWEINDYGMTDIKFSSGIKTENLLCRN